MKPVVLLDRDGTIIVDKNYLSEPAGVELLPGAVAGLKLLQQHGFELIVVTNQSGIGRGFYDETAMHKVNSRLCEILSQNGVKISPRRIYFCPHTPAEDCDCRKPRTGMVLKAQSEWLFDLRRGYVIGDKLADIELGHKLNLPAILIKSEHATAEAELAGELADYAAKDLEDAARWIVVGFSPHC